MQERCRQGNSGHASHFSNMLLAGAVQYNLCRPTVMMVFLILATLHSRFLHAKDERFLSHCGKADVWRFGIFVKGRVKRKHGWLSALTEEANFHWPVWNPPLFTCAVLKRECWYSWGRTTSEWRHRFLHNEQQGSKGYWSSRSFSLSSSIKTKQLDLC